MPAAVKDLRSFLNDLRARYPDDLVSVRREIDPRREVSLLVPHRGGTLGTSPNKSTYRSKLLYLAT